MSNRRVDRVYHLGVIVVAAAALLGFSGRTQAQNFDFDRLQRTIQEYSVIIDMKLQVSYGIQVNDHEERYVGTVVTEDGLVMFNGAALASDNLMSSYTGFAIKTTPVDIQVTTLDGRKYRGEYIGVDRFTRIAFLRIILERPEKLVPITFSQARSYKVGSWVALYMLLPEFISPPLAADVGMISSIIESPEYFPLTVGFNGLQITSVLFTEALEPVGVLGMMSDPTMSPADAGGMMDSYGQYAPLLGIITADRLARLIADPPQKGSVDRGWLGINLQALTTDMAEFWQLGIPGGIIVNDVIRNSPADRSGLAIGDIIYEVNGQQVDVDKDEKTPVFRRLIAEMGPDVPVEFSVIRLTESGVDTLTLLATLQTAPLAATDAPEYENRALEFKVRDLVFGDFVFYNLDSETFHGVVVSELKQGGLADLEGLEIGDIIQRIDDEPVYSIEDVRPIMDEFEQQQPPEVIFFVWRDKKTLFVNVKTDWR
ncbi:MAG: PDZ domain-containing protein [Candidatus Zixiibacteriota bacterium]|nr:MAG: PDZ domain-containing protein [candidate division Zixibacteria bacterium]